MGGADKDGSGWDGSFTPFDDAWPNPSNKHLLDLLRYGWTTEVVEGTNRVQVGGGAGCGAAGALGSGRVEEARRHTAAPNARAEPHHRCCVPPLWGNTQFVLAPGQDATYATEGGAAVFRFPSDMVGRKCWGGQGVVGADAPDSCHTRLSPG